MVKTTATVVVRAELRTRLDEAPAARRVRSIAGPRPGGVGMKPKVGMDYSWPLLSALRSSSGGRPVGLSTRPDRPPRGNAGRDPLLRGAARDAAAPVAGVPVVGCLRWMGVDYGV